MASRGPQRSPSPASVAAAPVLDLVLRPRTQTKSRRTKLRRNVDDPWTLLSFGTRRATEGSPSPFRVQVNVNTSHIVDEPNAVRYRTSRLPAAISTTMLPSSVHRTRGKQPMRPPPMIIDHCSVLITNIERSRHFY